MTLCNDINIFQKKHMCVICNFLECLTKYILFSIPALRWSGFSLKACNAARQHGLQNLKWPPGASTLADKVWKEVWPQVIGRSEQLWKNKSFDSNSHSTRKGFDWGNQKSKNGVEKTIVKIAIHYCPCHSTTKRWPSATATASDNLISCNKYTINLRANFLDRGKSPSQPFPMGYILLNWLYWRLYLYLVNHDKILYIYSILCIFLAMIHYNFINFWLLLQKCLTHFR